MCFCFSFFLFGNFVVQLLHCIFFIGPLADIRYKALNWRVYACGSIRSVVLVSRAAVLAQTYLVYEQQLWSTAVAFT